MNILVKAHIENMGEHGFIASVPKMPGLVVQALTIEKVKAELITSLKVKIAYDYGLEIDGMNGDVLMPNGDISAQVSNEPCEDQDIKLDLIGV